MSATKTIKRMPWNIKKGDIICTPDGNKEVVEIERSRGRFSGSTMWKFKYSCANSSLGYDSVIFHGKTNNLKPQKVTVII